MEITIDIILFLLFLALAFVAGMCVPGRVWREWEEKIWEGNRK